MRVLAIITARGGSKGIPRKNIRLLAGKPLLQYTAEAALAAKQLERVILSTEDEEIAQVGKICGLEVPFLRPPELARDDTPTLPVLQHAVNALEKTGARFDAICLLQPTAPLRQSNDIDACMISNLRFQIRRVSMENKIDQTLEEAAQVRADFVYPIMVTPLSQFVGSQAAINVIIGERYKQVTDQT